MANVQQGKAPVLGLRQQQRATDRSAGQHSRGSCPDIRVIDLHAILNLAQHPRGETVPLVASNSARRSDSNAALWDRCGIHVVPYTDGRLMQLQSDPANKQCEKGQVDPHSGCRKHNRCFVAQTRSQKSCRSLTGEKKLGGPAAPRQAKLHHEETECRSSKQRNPVIKNTLL